MQLLGFSGEEDSREVAWWDEHDGPAGAGAAVFGRGKIGRTEQAEFWGGGDAARRPSYVTDERTESDADGDALEPATSGVDGQTNDVNDEPAGARSAMSRFGVVGKFLRINGSIYDGNDDSRWLALPRGRREVPFQFHAGRLPAREFFRVPRSIPRDFSGISQRSGGSYIA